MKFLVNSLSVFPFGTFLSVTQPSPCFPEPAWTSAPSPYFSWKQLIVQLNSVVSYSVYLSLLRPGATTNCFFQFVGVALDLKSWHAVACHAAWGWLSMKDVVRLFFSVVFTQRASLLDLSSTSSTLAALKSCGTVVHWMLWSFRQLNFIAFFRYSRDQQMKLQHVNRKLTSYFYVKNNVSIFTNIFFRPNKAVFHNTDLQSPLEWTHA